VFAVFFCQKIVFLRKERVTGTTSTAVLLVMRHFFSLVLGLVWLASGIASVQAEGSFRFTGSLSQERRLHTATLLPNGKVLVAGGVFSAPGTAISSAELYDPQTGTWSATGSLHTARWFHTATLLVNGKVLVTGGVDDGVTKASSELYDPATGVWTETGILQDARYAHTETLLSDGRVLVTGGVKDQAPIATVEIYDPAAGTWSSKPDMSTARHYHAASLLVDGRVLVTGGYAGQHLSSAEIYDPVANTWTSMSSMAAPRYAFGQAVLADGRVLVAGGFGVDGAGAGILAGAEIYHPVTNIWQSAGSLGVACVGATLTKLPDGEVLAAAGFSSNRAVRAADLFNPVTNQWRAISPLRKGRNQHTATLLPDGKVLIVGGSDVDYTVLASAELYDPDAPPLPAELRVTRIPSGDVIVDGGTAHFRELSPGEQEMVSFSVTNTGPNSVTGLRWSLERSQAGAYALVSPPEALASGETAVFKILFMPEKMGQYQASLRIDHGHADAIFFTMDLVGPCADRPVNLALEDLSTGGMSAQVNFGAVEMGTSARKTFRLTNVGNRTFVGDVRMPLPWDLSMFFPDVPTVVSEYPRPGFYLVAPTRVILPPGQSMTFDLVFNPAGTDTITQTIQVMEETTGQVKRTFQAVGKGLRSASAMRGQVIYRLGDLQDLSVISGAPVNSEEGLLLGSPDLWDGWAGKRVSIGFVTYGFSPRLVPSISYMTRPLLLPRANGGGQFPAGSQAALHFEQGASMEQQDFGLRQGQNVGVQLWIKASSTTGTHPVLQVGDPDGDGMGIWQVDGVFRGRLARGAWVGEAPVQNGSWQHLALVCHGITSTLYLNGQPAGPTVFAQVRSSGTTTTNAGFVAPEKLRIGSFSAGTNSWFTGDLDELHFFTLEPGAAFSPQAELAPGAQPELHVVSSTSPVVTRASVSMLDRPVRLPYVEIVNVGSGIATITPQAIEGDAAGDYRLDWSGTGTWQDSQSGAQTTRTLAPGERWVVSVIFTPRAIGLRPATLRLQTTDPDLPEIVLSYHGQGIMAEPRLLISQRYSASTEEVVFGNVLLGSGVNSNVYLSNVGGLDITSLSARVTGPQADRFVVSAVEPYFNNQTPLPLLPGRSDYVMIRYTPDAADIDTAWLEIESSDPSAPLRKMLLSGRGVTPAPDILAQVSGIKGAVASGTTLSFGSAHVGQIAMSKDLGISNKGTATLNFSSLRFEGADAVDFFLRFPALQAGSTLEPGEGRTAGTIEFNPGAVGPRSARLVIESDDPDESPFILHLTGTGLPPEPEIALMDGHLELVSGQTLLRVGETPPGGAWVSRSVKLRNFGGAPLTGLAVTLGGRHPESFRVFGLDSSTLQPNQEFTLEVAFSAEHLGPHGATLVVSSNDADEPLYEIQLAGTGSYGETSLLYPDLPGWTSTAITEAPDGTVLIAGFITSSSGVKSHFVRRVARDGTETARHAQTVMPDGQINALALQLDGKVLLAGDFDSVGLLGRQGILRLNADGSLDLSFVPPAGDFAGRDVLVLPSGKIMVAGSGSLGSHANLARLNADGTLDVSFQIEAPNGPVNALALEEDGSVLVGGAFTNSLSYVQLTITLGGNLRRLKPDDQVDPTFGFSRLIYDIVTRGEDIYVAYRDESVGMSLGGTPGPRYDSIARLSHQGSVLASRELESFATAAECLSRTLAFQPGGGLLVAPGPRFWGSPDIQQISRYRSDTLAVDPGFYAVAGSPARIRALHVQADGRVLVGGRFEGINQWLGALTFGPPPPGATGDPVHADGAPVGGFAQLTHEGDFRPDLRLREAGSGRPLSDGLSTLEMKVESGTESAIVLQVASLINMQPSPPSTSLANLTIEFDGPHAGDFSAEVTSIVPSQQIYSNDALLTLRFRPTASGARQARMRLSIESLHRYGYAQNSFELNLRGFSGSLAPPNQVFMNQGGVLPQVTLTDTTVYDRFEARGLPPGMRMNPLTGQITGRATRPGSYEVTIRSRDKVTRIYTTRTVNLTVESSQTAGQYLGLLERDAGVLNGRGGLLSLSLNSSGTWSGTLQANLVAEKTTTHRFSGVLSILSPTEVSGSASIARAGSAPLALAFEVRNGVLAVRLGDVIVGRGGRALAQGSLVGTCHLGLLPVSAVPDRLVSGYARVMLTSRGTAALAGRLAHAIRPEVRALVQGMSWISMGDSDPMLPLFAPLTRGETVSGWLRIESGSTTLLTSTESACTVPPSVGENPIVPWAGGDAGIVVRGGLWLAPLPGTRLLGASAAAPNARIRVGPLSQDFTLTAAHQASPGGTAWLKPEMGGVIQALVTSASGAFSGRIWNVPYRPDPAASAPLAMPGGAFAGLFIPGIHQGIGLFTSLEKAPAGRYPEATPDVRVEVLE
jgi:uncharacterized delta-60 repeat protein